MLNNLTDLINRLRGGSSPYQLNASPSGRRTIRPLYIAAPVAGIALGIAVLAVAGSSGGDDNAPSLATLSTPTRTVSAGSTSTTGSNVTSDATGTPNVDATGTPGAGDPITTAGAPNTGVGASAGGSASTGGATAGGSGSAAGGATAGGSTSGGSTGTGGSTGGGVTLPTPRPTDVPPPTQPTQPVQQQPTATNVPAATNTPVPATTNTPIPPSATTVPQPTSTPIPPPATAAFNPATISLGGSTSATVTNYPASTLLFFVITQLSVNVSTSIPGVPSSLDLCPGTGVCNAQPPFPLNESTDANGAKTIPFAIPFTQASACQAARDYNASLTPAQAASKLKTSDSMSGKLGIRVTTQSGTPSKDALLTVNASLSSCTGL